MASDFASSSAQLVPGHSLSVAQTFPAELLDQIFENVDPKSLKSCNLTCRQWYTSSFPVLFRTVSIHEDPRSGPRLPLLIARLTTSTSLTSFVRKLVISGEADFTALQDVVTQIAALRTLRLCNVTFKHLNSTQTSKLEFPKKLMSLDKLALIDTRESWGSTVELRLFGRIITDNRPLDSPRVFDILGWFDSITTLKLDGFRLDTTTYLKNEVVKTSVDHVIFVLRRGLGSIHGHCSILQEKIDINSVRSVTFSVSSACMTAVVKHFLETLGENLNLVQFKVEYVVFCPPVQSSGTKDSVADIIARHGIIHFSSTPKLQHLCLNMQSSVNGTGVPFLCEQWKYLMANLVGQLPDLTVQLSICVTDSPRRLPSMIMKAIDWSLLNNLVVGRQQPPSIKLMINWSWWAVKRPKPEDHEREYSAHKDIITASTSPLTRSQLVFVEATKY